MKHAYWIGVALAIAGCAAQPLLGPPALEPAGYQSLAMVARAGVHECPASDTPDTRCWQRN